MSEKPYAGEAKELAARCGKIWLPLGKRDHPSSREQKAVRVAFREKQIDLEDAVEQAGGQRGSLHG